jgi:integrase
VGLRKRFLQARDKKGLILQSREKTPLDPANLISRKFLPAVGRAIEKATKAKDDAAVKALTDLRFHDLRHTYGSWMIHSGQDVLYVSRMLGHSRPSVTFDIYSHLIQKSRPHAAQAMDPLLFGTAVTGK